MLTLRHVTLYRQQAPLLRIPDLTITPGTPLTLMGPSGCGKSSLLTALIGALPQRNPRLHQDLCWEGTVLLNGEPLASLPTERRGIGLLFQDDLLFGHLTVADNLLFAVPPGPRQDRRETVHATLAQAGLTGLAARLPHQISGGQRARVSLLRALLAKPRALLLDEPFSRLDQPLRAAFRAWVFAQTQGIPVLLVTHDPADAPADVVYLQPLAPEVPDA